jgi:hypothetical protein
MKAVATLALALGLAGGALGQMDSSIDYKYEAVTSSQGQQGIKITVSTPDVNVGLFGAMAMYVVNPGDPGASVVRAYELRRIDGAPTEIVLWLTNPGYTNKQATEFAVLIIGAVGYKPIHGRLTTVTP